MKHWVPKINAGIDLARIALGQEEQALLGRIDGRSSNFDLAVMTGASIERVQQLLFRLFVEGVIGRADGDTATGDLAQLFIDQAPPHRREPGLLDNEAVVTAPIKPLTPAAAAVHGADSTGFELYDTAHTLPLIHNPTPAKPLRSAGVDEIEIDVEFESSVPTVKRTLVPPPTTAVQPVDPALLAACTDWGAAFAHTVPREFSPFATTLGDQKGGLEPPVSTSVETVVDLSEVVESEVATAPAAGRAMHNAAFAPTAPALKATPVPPTEPDPETVVDGDFAPTPTTKIAPRPGPAVSVDPEPLAIPTTKPSG